MECMYCGIIIEPRIPKKLVPKHHFMDSAALCESSLLPKSMNDTAVINDYQLIYINIYAIYVIYRCM